MFTILSASARQTETAGVIFSRWLRPGDVVAMTGGMGMGKTTFVRGVAAGLRCPDAVSSPTFALVNAYQGEMPVYHFDMYRISSWEDLDSTGFYDYLDGRGVLLIEWSENIAGALPPDCLRAHFAPWEPDGAAPAEAEPAGRRIVITRASAGPADGKNAR